MAGITESFAESHASERTAGGGSRREKVRGGQCDSRSAETGGRKEGSRGECNSRSAETGGRKESGRGECGGGSGTEARPQADAHDPDQGRLPAASRHK